MKRRQAALPTAIMLGALILAGAPRLPYKRSKQGGRASDTPQPQKTALAQYVMDGLVALPDANVTPGATLPVGKDQVCRPGYAKRVRNVSTAEKRRVYREYGATPQKGVCCEVDHLISLELGGSNQIANLWPQPYQPRPGAREKDTLEDALHKLVCEGKMTLPEAQREISTNWDAAYDRIILTRLTTKREEAK